MRKGHDQKRRMHRQTYLLVDAIDAGKRVEHVRRGVSTQRQHLLVREFVVAFTIHAQISVLDC